MGCCCRFRNSTLERETVMSPTVRALEWLNAMALSLVVRLNSSEREDRDRGDVPGWVMITVMTPAAQSQ